jgi:hypothetical protein
MSSRSSMMSKAVRPWPALLATFLGDRPRADGWSQNPKGRTLAGARGGAPKPQRNKAASACARASCAMGSSPDGRDPPIPLAGSAGLGSGRGSRARMLATRSAGERSLIGVGVVCRMEYRAGHAWEHDGAPLSGQRRSARYRRLLSVTEIFDQEKRAGGGQMARSPPCSGALQAL